MKKTFNENSYLDIDEMNVVKKSTTKVNQSDVALRTDEIDQNEELQAEMLRRKLFNFLWKLKFIVVDPSMTKSIFSFSQDKFISQKLKKDDWQLRVFGPSRPYILGIINFNPKNQFPEIANGYLGLQGFSDEVQMQSLFSGSSMETHRSAIPSWTIRNITIVYDLKGNNIVTGRRLDLDMSNGRLVQVLYSDNCVIEQQIYAHQILKSLIVHEIQVQFLTSKLDVIVLKLPGDRKRDISSNIDITDESDNVKYIRMFSGITHVNDQKNHKQHIHAFAHVTPEEIRINYSNNVIKYYYLLSVNEEKEVARHHFDEGMTLIEDGNQLFVQHDYVWMTLWSKSGIFMRRSNVLDVPLISAQYLVNSNLPSIGRMDAEGAIGATGLGVSSNQGAGHSLDTNCGGRIEYSQELWMINSQMLLHPESVRAIIKKRISQLSVSKTNALSLGFSGAKYPAATNELGEDLCEGQEMCKNMHFPTGLVALALEKYLMATGDLELFTNETGLGVLIEINKYWESIFRAYKSNKMESVPLGNHNITVKNSVFDLGLMKETFMVIPILMDFFNIVPQYNTDFVKYLIELRNMSQAITLPIDTLRNYHPSYDGFDVATDELHLPDVVMLRYPLDHLIDIDLSGRHLLTYDKKLKRPLNPMSLSMLFINNLDADRVSASNDNFRDLIKFCDNEYKIWTNDSRHWQGSFIPAAAGYIDAVVFGLLGVRIRRSGLYLFPKLVLDISLIEVSNLEYLGSTIRVLVDAKRGISVRVVASRQHSWKLGLMNVVTKSTQMLLDGDVTVPLGTHIVIRRLKSKS